MVWNVLNITYIRKMYCAERPMLFYWLRIRLADFQLWQSRFVDVLSVSLLDSYHLIPLPVTLLDLHVVSIQKIYQTLEIIHFQHLLSQTIPSTSSFVTNTSLSVVFSILLLVFRIVLKHCLSTLIFRLDEVNPRYFRMLISIYKCLDYLIEEISFLQKQKDAAIVDK